MKGDASHDPTTSLPRQMLQAYEDVALNLSTKHRSPPHTAYARPPPRPILRVYPAIQKARAIDVASLEATIVEKAGPKACLSPMDETTKEDSPMDYHGLPMSRKERDFVPDTLKDETYWSKRVRNNLAARRSREKRRMVDSMLENKVSKLAQENQDLKSELANIKQMLQEKFTPEPRRDALIYARDSLEQRLDDYMPYPPEKRPRLPMYSPPRLPFPPEERPRLAVDLEPHTASHRLQQHAGSFAQYCSPFNELPTRTSVRPPPELARVHRLDFCPPQVVPGNAPRFLAGGPFPPHSRISNSGPQHIISEQQFVSGVPFGVSAERGRRPDGTLRLPAREVHNPGLPRGIARSRQVDVAEQAAMQRVLPRSVPPVPSDSVPERKTPISSTVVPELEILTPNDTPCSSSKDSSSSTASLSPTLSDQAEALSPSEISRLPHKLRNKMLRALPPQKDIVAVPPREPEQCLPTEKEPVKFDENVVAHIKKERVEEEDVAAIVIPSANEQNTLSENTATPSTQHRIRPKQEFPLHHMRSIEEELEQACSLLANPGPGRKMTPDESEAYVEMMRAATMLVDARLTVNDFNVPTVRQRTRQRTRDMNAEEKYRDKRVRNNIAAKKCRDAKRLLTEYRAARSKFFGVENITLRNELEELTSEVTKLRELARMRNCPLT